MPLADDSVENDLSLSEEFREIDSENSLKDINSMNNGHVSSNEPQTGFTVSVPESYLQPIAQAGYIEPFNYASLDYARNQSPISKSAYVYLPYGYDPADSQTRYNIIYLMHGWLSNETHFFTYADLNVLLDNLIANDNMDPAIVVCPTFYGPHSSSAFAESVEDVRAFHLDFENHLMPAIENTYNTFATDTTPNALKASRDHRAFGGFSLGAVTTWFEFIYDSDYISNFLPLAGDCWYFGSYGDFQPQQNVDFLAALVKEKHLDERGYFIFEMIGTDDALMSQTTEMMDLMLAKPDVFTPRHFRFYEMEGGEHDFEAAREFLYNGLPALFR